MAHKLVLEPTDKHPISIDEHVGGVIVSVDGRLIANTTRALVLREANYPPVFYIPLADVDKARLVATDHSSYCPYKGDASYYSIPIAGEAGENAVWEYREPYPAVAQITGHVAFYEDRVQILK